MLSADDGIQDMTRRTFKTARAVDEGGVMVSDSADDGVNSVRHRGDDKHRIFLVALEKQLDYLSIYVLVYYGVKRAVKSEQHAGGHKYDDVSHKYVGPGVDTFFLGKEYGNKIRSSSACSVDQTYAHAGSVDYTAENTDEQSVISDSDRRKDVGQKPRKDDHIKRIKGKSLAYIFDAEICRYEVQRQVDGRIRQADVKKPRAGLLYENRHAAEAAREKSSGFNETFQVKGDHRRSDSQTEYCPDFSFYCVSVLLCHFRFLFSSGRRLILRRYFAYVYPSGSAGIFKKFVTCEFYGAV